LWIIIRLKVVPGSQGWQKSTSFFPKAVSKVPTRLQSKSSLITGKNFFTWFGVSSWNSILVTRLWVKRGLPFFNQARNPRISKRSRQYIPLFGDLGVFPNFVGTSPGFVGTLPPFSSPLPPYKISKTGS